MKPEMKNILAAGLEEILETKSFNKITVTDITTHCGVSRMSFYRHYRDKYECMNWVYQKQVNEIVAENNEITSWKNLNFQISKFMYSKKDFFANVSRYKEQNSLMECIYKCGVEYAETRIKIEINQEALPINISYAIDMYICGCVKIIERWLNNGCEDGPELLTEVLNSGIPVILAQYFKG